MEFIYAQLNEDLVCIGISILSDEVNSDTLVKLEMLDESCIGRKYEDGEWSEEKYIEEHKEEIRNLIESKIGKKLDIDVRQVEEGRRFEDSFVDIEKLINMDIVVEDD